MIRRNVNDLMADIFSDRTRCAASLARILKKDGVARLSGSEVRPLYRHITACTCFSENANSMTDAPQLSDRRDFSR